MSVILGLLLSTIWSWKLVSHPVWPDIPPRRYDHWPTIPVMMMNYPIRQVDFICGGSYNSEGQQADGVVEGCEEDIASPWLGRSIGDRLPDKDQDRLRHFKITHDDNGCVIIVPSVSYEISKKEQWYVWRHELGHCNGWGAAHEK